MIKFVSDKAPIPLMSLMIYCSTIILPLGYFLYSGGKFQASNNVLALAIITGIFLAAGSIMMLYAFRISSASQVIPIVNLNTLVTVGLAILILNEKLTPKIGLGIVFAVVSIYLLTT